MGVVLFLVVTYAAVKGVEAGAKAFGRKIGATYTAKLDAWSGGSRAVPVVAAKTGAVLAAGTYGTALATGAFVRAFRPAWRDGKVRARERWGKPNPAWDEGELTRQQDQLATAGRCLFLVDPDATGLARYCGKTAAELDLYCPQHQPETFPASPSSPGLPESPAPGDVAPSPGRREPPLHGRCLWVINPTAERVSNRMCGNRIELTELYCPEHPPGDSADPATAAAEPQPLRLVETSPNGTSEQQEGNTMIETKTGGEVLNLGQLIAELQAISTEAASDLEDAHADAKRATEDAQRVDTMVASLRALDLDSDTLGEVGALGDSAAARQAAADQRAAAAEARNAQALAALQGVQARHQLMQEAHAATPHAADKQFYGG